jgi:transposase IS4-like protein/DDE family transposase
LSGQCATVSYTRTTTVAAGVFAPGHLGELTEYVPFELVDAVLAETGTVQRRLRDLPSRVGVYFLLAMGLFPRLGYLRVWDKLVAGLAGLPLPTPSEKGLRVLRRRLGPAPLKLLFDTLAVPLARPDTPGVAYARWRTVAFDGCSSIKVPDAERNRDWLGRIRGRMGWAGYPTVMLMTLCETGTRGLLGAVAGPADKGEIAYATRLLSRLDASMLLLGDRAFDANELLRQAAATGAQLLIRAKSTRRPAVMATLPDGTALTEIAGVRLRIIDVHLLVRLADGSRINDRYRLLTTLTDHRHHRAERLVHLYHERWEVESAYFALRHTLLDQHVLRSGDPVGLETVG